MGKDVLWFRTVFLIEVVNRASFCSWARGNGVGNRLRWTGCAWSGSLAVRGGHVGVHVVADGNAHVAACALRAGGLAPADSRGTRSVQHPRVPAALHENPRTKVPNLVASLP